MSLSTPQRHYVLLDRDGTIIVERNYLSDPDDVALLAGAAAGLRSLREHGFGLIVVTNQSGIARGLFDESRLQEIHGRMAHLLGQEGVELDGVYHCPHLPDDGCACRKPEPGMALRAATDFGFATDRAFVVGDAASDIALGRRLDAVTILVRTGYGAKVESEGGAQADHVAADLEEAAAVIIGSAMAQKAAG